MHFIHRKSLLLVMVSTSLCTCVTSLSEAEDFKPTEHSVQLADQKYIVEQLKQSKVETEARCLFSSSGWAYPGQHCVIIDKGTIRLLQKLQNAKQFRELSPDELAAKVKLLDFDKVAEKFKDLKSTFADALDHTRYQFLILKNQKNQIVVLKNLLIDNPRAPKEHINFANEFVDLFKTRPIQKP